jgi:hypothetical protein
VSQQHDRKTNDCSRNIHSQIHILYKDINYLFKNTYNQYQKLECSYLE